MSDFPAKRTYSTPLAKTAMNEPKLRLYAPIPDSKRKASLEVTTITNNIHMVVYTNVEGDQNKGIIRARFDTLSFFAFLRALADVIDGGKDEGGKYPSFRIPCKKVKQGGSFGDLVDDVTVHASREEDGRIYIAVTDGAATNVKFHFGPTDFHNGWAFNGKPIDGPQLSNIYASAWGAVMNQLAPNVLAANYIMPEPRQPNANQKFGNQKPSYNAPAAGDWSEGTNDDFPV